MAELSVSYAQNSCCRLQASWSRGGQSCSSRVKEEFHIPLRSRNWRRNRLNDMPSEFRNRMCDLFNGEFVNLRIAHDAAFPNVAPPRLELGLNQNHGLRKCRGRSKYWS